MKMCFSLKYAIKEIFIKISSVVLTRRNTYSFCLAILFACLTMYFIVHFEAWKTKYFWFFLQNRKNKTDLLYRLYKGQDSLEWRVVKCTASAPVYTETSGLNVRPKPSKLHSVDVLYGKGIFSWSGWSSYVWNWSAFKPFRSWMVYSMAVRSKSCLPALPCVLPPSPAHIVEPCLPAWPALVFFRWVQDLYTHGEVTLFCVPVSRRHFLLSMGLKLAVGPS